MTSLGEMKFPPNVSPKVKEAITEVLALVEAGFTGNLTIDFSEGVPVVSKRVEITKFRGPTTPGSA